MSQRFYRLVPDIKEFFKQHKLIDQFPKLSDDNWLIQLAFVVDITFHLNNLNLQLQGKDTLLPLTINKVSAFSRKLALFREQLLKKDFINFPTFGNSLINKDFDLENIIGVIDALIKNFSKRFDSDTMNVFRLSSHFISHPNLFTLEDLQILSNHFLFSLSALQNEFLELQSEAVLSVPNESELISYWKNLKYVNLRLLAAKILSIFSTTYVCESTFSIMKNIKSRLRSHLLDESLEAELICSVTELEPDYIKLVKDIECHISN